MIKCKHCEEPTLTVSPIILKHFNSGYFNVRGLCSKCLNSKAKFLTKKEADLLPSFFNYLPGSKTFVEYIDYGNGQKLKIMDFFDKIINV